MRFHTTPPGVTLSPRSPLSRSDKHGVHVFKNTVYIAGIQPPVTLYANMLQQQCVSLVWWALREKMEVCIIKVIPAPDMIDNRSRNTVGLCILHSYPVFISIICPHFSGACPAPSPRQIIWRSTDSLGASGPWYFDPCRYISVMPTLQK